MKFKDAKGIKFYNFLKILHLSLRTFMQSYSEDKHTACNTLRRLNPKFCSACIFPPKWDVIGDNRHNINDNNGGDSYTFWQKIIFKNVLCKTSGDLKAAVFNAGLKNLIANPGGREV